MRRISVDEVQEGMTLAKPVYGSNGQIIVNNDVVLQSTHITRLKNMDVDSVYVHGDGTHYIDENDVEAQQLRAHILSEAHKILESVKFGKYVDVSNLKEQVLSLLDELCCHRELQPIFLEMKEYNNYLFAHAVSGYLVAMLMGISLGFEGMKLQDLGVGAMLRDVGMIKLDKEIVNKPGKLSPEETEVIRSHPKIGFEMLRNNPDISLISANCALQHHERYDGSGYPRSLSNGDIHELSQIISVADVYSSLVIQTPYRNALPVYDTLAIIQRTAGAYFNPDFVRTLTKNVVKYPLSAVVRLNNKQMATVIKHKDFDQTIPIVRIPRNEGGQISSDVVEINPMENQLLYIAEVM